MTVNHRSAWDTLYLFSRIAFADLACGEPVVPDTASHEQARADLERIYGDHTRVARDLEDRLQVNQ